MFFLTLYHIKVLGLDSKKLLLLFVSEKICLFLMAKLIGQWHDKNDKGNTDKYTTFLRSVLVKMA